MKSVKNAAAPAGNKAVGFVDRLSTAAAARKAQLERCRAKPGADNQAAEHSAAGDATRKAAK